jgi:NAD(P)H-dependent FMN reductase
VLDRIATDFPGIDADFADLGELALPFMDEPKHPRLREYTHAHTLAWSARVEAADAVLFVTPEYNHGSAPALKNAIDYLIEEWAYKPYGLVNYGGVSAGTRAAASLAPTLAMLGMLRARAAVEIGFPGARVSDGAFAATESEAVRLDTMLAELEELAGALAPLRA